MPDIKTIPQKAPVKPGKKEETPAEPMRRNPLQPGPSIDPSRKAAAINEMAVPYKGPDRMPADKERDLRTERTPLGPNHPGLPLPKENVNAHEDIASHAFHADMERVRKYTGHERPMENIHNMAEIAGRTYMQIAPIEHRHKKELEELAVTLALHMLGIPRDAIDIDAKLITMQPHPKKHFDQPEKSRPSSQEKEQANTHPDFDAEVAKRKLINVMTQGVANNGYWMFKMADRETNPELAIKRGLNEIDPRLMDLYNRVMSSNAALYWAIPDDHPGLMAVAYEQVNHPDKKGGKSKITARAPMFPILVHEIIKGIYEVMSAHGYPKDEALAKAVLEKADKLEHEKWDLRIGPEVWKRFTAAAGAQGMTLHQLYVDLLAMPAKEFLAIMREILSGSAMGKEHLRRRLRQIEAEAKEAEKKPSFKDNEQPSWHPEDDGEEGESW